MPRVLRKLREQSGLTQQTLARIYRCSPQNIAKLERGRDIRVSAAAKYGAAMGLPVVMRVGEINLLQHVGLPKRVLARIPQPTVEHAPEPVEQLQPTVEPTEALVKRSRKLADEIWSHIRYAVEQDIGSRIDTSGFGAWDAEEILERLKHDVETIVTDYNLSVRRVRRRQADIPVPFKVSKAMEVLGIYCSPKKLTHDLVKKAWRSRASSNHPDRVQHSSPEIQQKVERRFVEYTDAYEVLKRHLGA